MPDVLMPNDLTKAENTAHSRIKKLSPLLINQLAAGEVVTRPAAVVKELLENAIDANATDIEVHITQGGMGMIQVIDNGVGIHPDDMVMAITRHATSKIADVANLHGISTLGFRGEALAATAAVSRLTLASSYDDSGIGRQLQVAGVLAEEPKLMPVVHSRGTTVTIKDLYFNVPARRGNLKSIATEFAHIETIVREVALARADVTLTLCHDNKKRLSLSANIKANDNTSFANATANNNRYLPISRLEQALDLALAEEALAVWVDLTSLLTQATSATTGHQPQLIETQQASISGWLWPTAQVSKQLPKLLYVNGRLIKEPIISNQLRQLATSAGLAAMGYALYFELPSHWLNVNVHPSKQRIKISPLNNVLAHLSHVIAKKLKTVVVNSPKATLSNEYLSDNPLDNTNNTSSGGNESILHSAKQYASVTNHQLHSTKQPYQCSQQPSSYPPTFDDNNAYKEKSLENNSFADKNLTQKGMDKSYEQIDIGSINNPAKLAMLSTLPYCLEVVTDLSMSAFWVADDNQLDALPYSPPWLLFYNQGQLIVMEQSTWQHSFNSIFAFDNDNPSSNIDKDLNVNEPLDQYLKQQINQQISHYATQMSLPDLQAFATDMTQIFNHKAITHIDSKQLIPLMLSSAKP